MTSTNDYKLRVTGPLWGESTGDRWFPSQRSVTPSFDVLFDLRLNSRLYKQTRRRWFDTPSRSLCPFSPNNNKKRTKGLPYPNKALQHRHVIRNYSLYFFQTLFKISWKYVHTFSVILLPEKLFISNHYNDVMMGAMAFQITSLTIVYSTVYSRQKSKKTSKLHVTALVRGIPRWPVNSPHKWPVMRKMFPFDYAIMSM